MTAPVTTRLDAIKAATAEDKLFERAVHDAIAAMMRRATVGRSITEAITALDHLREEFERVHHDRPNTIRIPGWGRRA